MYDRIETPTLKKSLSSARNKAGFSQRQVEKSLGMRQLTIYDYESGRLKLPVDQAVDLANLYHCKLEDLLGITNRDDSKQKEDNSPQKLYPLVNVGLLHDEQFKRVQKIYLDPVIQAEAKLFDYNEQESPVQLLLETLSQKQQQQITIEILKYVNSLIGVDNKISREEELFRNYLRKGLKLTLTDAEHASIRKALITPYFGRNAETVFKTEALKHLLIWILMLSAYADNEIHQKEFSYIKKVSEHIKLPVVNFTYIDKKMKNFKEN